MAGVGEGARHSATVSTPTGEDATALLGRHPQLSPKQRIGHYQLRAQIWPNGPVWKPGGQL